MLYITFGIICLSNRWKILLNILGKQLHFILLLLCFILNGYYGLLLLVASCSLYRYVDVLICIHAYIYVYMHTDVYMYL